MTDDSYIHLAEVQLGETLSYCPGLHSLALECFARFGEIRFASILSPLPVTVRLIEFSIILHHKSHQGLDFTDLVGALQAPQFSELTVVTIKSPTYSFRVEGFNLSNPGFPQELQSRLGNGGPWSETITLIFSAVV